LLVAQNMRVDCQCDPRVATAQLLLHQSRGRTVRK
jgi:hypothetical protein